MCITVAWIRNCGLLKTKRMINTRTRRTVVIVQARWFSTVSHLMIYLLKISIDFVRKHSSLSKWAIKANMLWKKSRGRGVRESKCRQLYWLNRNFNLAKPSWLFSSSRFAVLSSASERWLSVLFFPVIPNMGGEGGMFFFLSPGLLSHYSWSKSCMKMTRSTE